MPTNRRRLESLTPEQAALMPVIRDKWLALGLSTAPADRPKAEAGIRLAYQRAGLTEPASIVWLTSPMAGALGYAVVREWGSRTLTSKTQGAVWDSVWDSVRDSVGASVGDSVWDSVRASVGDSVGASVGDSVWDSVWDSVRDSVGDSVGDSVWDSVRDSVRDSVGDSVGDSGYGQHDAGWLAFFDFFREIGLREETEKLDGLTAYSAHAGWFWPFQGLVILTDRPTHLARDANGRLHDASRAAIEYRDGWGVYAWHGLRVAESIILRPDLITPTQIRDERNTELRRVLLERFGADRFVREIGAAPLHRDHTGTLYRVELDGDEPLVLVRVTNSTAEIAAREGLIQAADGTWRKEYWIRVPPSMTTAREAVGWTFGLPASEYAPLYET